MANAVPHFVQGVSGNKFPSPFAKPSGKGLSSPVVNVIWALGNTLIGYVLFQLGHVNSTNLLSLVVFFLGIATVSIMSGVIFQRKDSE